MLKVSMIDMKYYFRDSHRSLDQADDLECEYCSKPLDFRSKAWICNNDDCETDDKEFMIYCSRCAKNTYYTPQNKKFNCLRDNNQMVFY